MEARAGVVLATDVNGPLPVASGSLIDTKSPAFWAFVFFLVAALLLFVI